MELYVICVPYPQSTVGSAGYSVVPGFDIGALNCKKTVVTELIYRIIIELNIATILYSEPVTMSIMHIHIMDSYIAGVEEINHIVITFAFSQFTVTIMIYIDLEASYCNIIIS